MRRIVFILLISIISVYMKGQYSDDPYGNRNIPNITPISPNAASLGIFGAVPVGHYTGLPDISIPIYEIDLDGKKIPIKLSYHASGIRVSQEASSVGLGWALNAGGCIVREIRGCDDFSTSSPRGYYYDTEFPTWDANNNIDKGKYAAEYHLYKSFLDNDSDSEPDLFHFNFASFSGTMFFNKKNDQENTATKAKGIIRKMNEYLDVTINLPNKLDIIISDGDGFKYYFSPSEKSKSYILTTNSYSTYDKSKFAPTASAYNNNYTAWHLDSIVSPKNKKISFSYEREMIVTPISVSEDVSYLISGGTANGVGYHGYYTYSYSESEQTRIKAISFDGGSVSFNYSDRLDLESRNTDKAKKLESVIVNNNKKDIIKSATFQQSYMGYTGTTNNCRLMLDTVKLDNHTNEPLLYTFKYNKGILPSKESPSTDYWGYYNNSTPPQAIQGNGTFKLSPSIYFYVNKNGKDEIRAHRGLYKGTHDDCVKYGILSEIQYPTGGKSVFEFEPHYFENSIMEQRERQISYSLLELNDENYYSNGSEKFEVKEGGAVNVEIRYIHYRPNPGYDVDSRMHIDIRKDDYTLVKDYIIVTDQNSYPNSEYSDEGIEIITDYLQFSPGRYFIHAYGAMNDQGRKPYYVRSTFSKITREPYNKGGGLRVKSITDYIDDTESTKKEFSYKGGVLMSPPQHHSVYSVLETELGAIGINGVEIRETEGRYINGYSTPYTPFSNSAQGGHVGYSYVEEKTVENGNETSHNGITLYKFVNIQDEPENLSDRLIKGFPAFSHQDNGSPLEIRYFDKNNTLIKLKTFQYSDRQIVGNIKGLKVFQSPMTKNHMSIKFYDQFSERWDLLKTTEYNYHEKSIEPVETITEYKYNDSNLRQNSEKTTNSNGVIVEKLTKYPIDYTSTMHINMKNNHMVNMPIEVTTNITTGGKTTEISKYKLDYITDASRTKNLILPDKVLSSSGTSGLRTDLTYDLYDSKGNIRQYTTFENVRTVYLWSYSGQYPIAEIKNATYDQIKTILGETLINRLSDAIVPSTADMQAINNLRKNAALKDVHITTYTYKPLVGIQTMTDPSGLTTTYEYDDFNRLKAIKDPEGKTIESYQYHYKN